MAPNFKHLIQKPAADFKRPDLQPEGIYFGTVDKFEFGESAKKKTPFVRYSGKLTHAHPDVDLTVVDEKTGEVRQYDVTKGQWRQDFYLTENALFMLNEFHEKMGVDVADGTIEDHIPMVKGSAVQVLMKHVPGGEDGSRTICVTDKVTAVGADD